MSQLLCAQPGGSELRGDDRGHFGNVDKLPNLTSFGPVSVLAAHRQNLDTDRVDDGVGSRGRRAAGSFFPRSGDSAGRSTPRGHMRQELTFQCRGSRSQPRNAFRTAAAIRRLLGRLQTAWENGSLWVSLVIGMGFLPVPFLILFADTTIVASGAAVGTQVSAVIAFVVGMFAVVEITLVSYLVAPAKTLAVLRPLRDWALAHGRKILVAIFAVAGFFQVAKGMGIV